MKNILEDNYISIEEAAVYLGIKVVTLRTWIKLKHDLPAHKIGKQWKFKKTELDEWVKSGKSALEQVGEIMRFIGCKTLLLDNIKQVIDENVKGAESFCDIFSGTSTVARYFKRWYQVYSNDLLYFSYVLQRGTIQNDKLPAFKKLNKIKNI